MEGESKNPKKSSHNSLSRDESSFSTIPIESDFQSTNEDSASNDEKTLLGKRKLTLNSEEIESSTKRQRINSDMGKSCQD